MPDAIHQPYRPDQSADVACLSLSVQDCGFWPRSSCVLIAPMGALEGSARAVTYALVIPGTLPFVVLTRMLVKLRGDQTVHGHRGGHRDCVADRRHCHRLVSARLWRHPAASHQLRCRDSVGRRGRPRSGHYHEQGSNLTHDPLPLVAHCDHRDCRCIYYRGCRPARHGLCHSLFLRRHRENGMARTIQYGFPRPF